MNPRTFLTYGLFGLCIGWPALAQGQDSSWFSDVTEQSGLVGKTAFRIYAVDLNGDDYPDVLVQNVTSTHRNNLSLLLNEPDPQSANPTDRVFVDITAPSGINANPDPAEPGRQSNSAAFADVDNDGDVDLIACPHYHRIEDKSDYHEQDRCEVLLNDGAASFSIKENNGLHELGLLNVAGLSFLDYDKDGNVDLFIANWFANYTKNVYGADLLLRGNGDGSKSVP